MTENAQGDIGNILRKLRAEVDARSSVAPDIFPLRRDQFMIGAKKLSDRMESLKVHDLEDQLRSDILRWSFTPFASFNDGPIVLTKDEKVFENKRIVGKQYLEMIPTLVAHYRSIDKQSWERGFSIQERARHGGTSVRVGNLRLDETELDDLINESLDLIPYWSKEGPNGVWHIERGDCHPVVTLAESIRLYSPTIDDNLLLDSSKSQPWHRSVLGYFFSSMERAQSWIDAHSDTKSSETVKVVEMSGRSILSIMPKLSTMNVDGVSYGMTFSACREDGVNKKQKHLVAALEKIAANQSVSQPRNGERHVG